jgi:hypothetical protein
MAKLAVQQIEAAFTAARDGGDVPSAAIFEAIAESPRACPKTRQALRVCLKSNSLAHVLRDARFAGSSG